MSSLSLDTDVRAALEKRRGEWKRIALQCDVSHSWISQFMRGKLKRPGHLQLVKLGDCLGLGSKPSKGGAH